MTLEELFLELQERNPSLTKEKFRASFDLFKAVMRREPRSIEDFLVEHEDLAYHAFYQAVVDLGLVTNDSSQAYLDLLDSQFDRIWKLYGKPMPGEEGLTFKEFVLPIITPRIVRGEGGEEMLKTAEGGLPSERQVRDTARSAYQQATGFAPSEDTLDSLVRKGTEGLEDVAFDDAFARVVPQLRQELDRTLALRDEAGQPRAITDAELVDIRNLMRGTFADALATGQDIPVASEFIRAQLPTVAQGEFERLAEEAEAETPQGKAVAARETELQEAREITDADVKKRAEVVGGPPTPPGFELGRVTEEGEPVRLVKTTEEVALGRLARGTAGAKVVSEVPSRAEFAEAFVGEQKDPGFQKFLRGVFGTPFKHGTLEREFGEAITPEFQERVGQRTPSYLDFLRERVPVFQRQFTTQQEETGKAEAVSETQRVDTERAIGRRRQLRGRSASSTFTVRPPA